MARQGLDRFQQSELHVLLGRSGGHGPAGVCGAVAHKCGGISGLARSPEQKGPSCSLASLPALVAVTVPALSMLLSPFPSQHFVTQ